MTKRTINGYAMRQEITRALNANKAARLSLQRIIEDQPGPQNLAIQLAKAAQALSENLEAIREIEQIITISE